MYLVQIQSEKAPVQEFVCSGVDVATSRFLEVPEPKVMHIKEIQFESCFTTPSVINPYEDKQDEDKQE